MSNTPHIPILRQGRIYESLDVADLHHIGSVNQVVGRISQANPGLIRHDLPKLSAAKRALAAFAVADLVSIAKTAGDLFLHGSLPLSGEISQTPDDYIRQLSATSGLPHSLIRLNMGKLSQPFQGLDDVLNGLTRGLDWAVFDSGITAQAGIPISYSALTTELGVILPSNSPAVNALWIPAIAMKIPVVIKPGREEPWTPWRIIQAFLAAGAPPEAFSFYPAGHDGTQAILQNCGRVMMFGDDATVAKHTANPRVEVHGTGHSKILIGNDQAENWPDLLPVLVESIAGNSGRSCINTSTIMTTRYSAELAHAIAAELHKIQVLPLDNPNSQLAGFANPAMADAIDNAITVTLSTPGAVDISAKLRGGSPRLVTQNNMHYLLPTITLIDSFDHPIANKEFLFPCCSVVEMPQSHMLNHIGRSLAVTAITNDEEWIAKLLACPDIDRLNIGAYPTCRVNWSQPHEGNLFEFLYKRRSIHVVRK